MKKLIVFTSPTCGPCRRQKAEIDEFLDEHPDAWIEIKDLSKPEDLEVAQSLNVMRVPTQVLVDESGNAVKTNAGVLPADKLEEFLGL